MRRAWVAVAALAGVLAGGAGTLAVQPGPQSAAPAAPAAPRQVEGDRRPGPSVLLVWTPGGLPGGAAGGVRRLPGVTAVSVVAGGPVDLAGSEDAAGRPVDDLGDGWRIPLDVAVVDPAAHSAFAPAEARPLLAGLAPGRALLGATSARLRRVGVGGSLRLVDGRRLDVVGVVDDAVVGAAEVVVGPDDGRALGWPPRYLLVAYEGERAALERSVRALLLPLRSGDVNRRHSGSSRRQNGGEGGEAVRFRAPGESPFLREGDAVLPQALVKERFGEFAYRPGPGRDVEQDPAWQRAHLVTTTVPLLGRVRCHRALLPALQGALAELEARGLGYLVSREGFAGSWAPRRISPGAPLSRHAWGVALDVEHPAHPTGASVAQDARLVAVMERWGFTSGADWLVPDPAHFEYLRPPSPPP